MPKNKVSDPITDQEMAFARLVLSGAMTDRHAAEAVGLNPDSAAYTKSKPHVRAYMLEHRAAVQQQLVQQEAEGLHRLNLDREKVLNRLWEIANLSPEITRNSITGQVKALSMIIAMQNFIPACPGLPWDPRAVSSQEKPAPASAQPQTYPAVGPTTTDPQPSPAPGKLAPGSAAEPALPAPACRGSEVEEWAPPNPHPSHSTFAKRFTPLEAPSLPLYVPLFASIPDLGVPLPIKNPFVRPR